MDHRELARRRTSFPQPSGLLVVTAVLLAGLAPLAVRVHSMIGPLHVDRWVSGHLAERLPVAGFRLGYSGYDAIARAGAPAFVVMAMVLALGWAIHRRDVEGGLLAVAGPGVALVLAELVAKPLIGRQDPAGSWSFPSGTVTVVAASVAVSVILVYRWAGLTRAITTALVLVVVPIVMCVAVVEVHWHYATDAVAGLALGAAVACGLAAVLAALEHTYRRPHLADLSP
jgi:membrane-associated phospholipid phosphatase